MKPAVNIMRGPLSLWPRSSEAALSEALNEDVTLNMRRGKATDSATMARAISSLTSSGMDLETCDHLGRVMSTAGRYFSPYFFDSLDPAESVKLAPVVGEGFPRESARAEHAVDRLRRLRDEPTSAQSAGTPSGGDERDY